MAPRSARPARPPPAGGPDPGAGSAPLEGTAEAEAPGGAPPQRLPHLTRGFQAADGERRGRRQQEFRQFADGCRHYQWYDACHRIWDVQTDETAGSTGPPATGIESGGTASREDALSSREPLVQAELSKIEGVNAFAFNLLVPPRPAGGPGGLPVQMGATNSTAGFQVVTNR